MDRGAWWATVHGVAKSRHDEQLSPSLSALFMLLYPGPSFIICLFSLLHCLIQFHG